MKLLWEDPEFKAARSEDMRHKWEDSEFRVKVVEAARENMTRLNNDPNFVAPRHAALGALSYTTAQPNHEPRVLGERAVVARETMTRLNSDPGFIVRRDATSTATMTRLNADPEFRAATGERMKRRWAEYRAAKAEAVKRPEITSETVKQQPTTRPKRGMGFAP